MRLYVANCTSQTQNIHYRLFESKRPHIQTCDAASQIPLGGLDLNPLQVQDLIKQLRTYGLYLVDEVSQLPRGVIVSFLASPDKQVTTDQYRAALEHNTNVLFQRGKKFREEAAIASANDIAKMTPEAADTLAITIQEDRPGTGADGGEPTNEGIRVSRRFEASA